MSEASLQGRVGARRHAVLLLRRSVTPRAGTSSPRPAKSSSANVEAARAGRLACCDQRRDRLAGIIGDPVRHSLSPLLHNTAYPSSASTGCTSRSRCPDGGAAAALDAMRDARARRAVGDDAAQDRRRGRVRRAQRLRRRLRSVNTVTSPRRRLAAGDSTDGEGFVRALREAGREPAGARCSCSARAARRARSSSRSPAPARASPSPPAGPTAAAAAAALVGGDRPWRGTDRATRRRPSRRSSSTRRRSAWAGTGDAARPRGGLRSGSGRRRPRVPPARDAAARGRRAPPAPRPSTGSACSSTRPPCRSSGGPGARPRSVRCAGRSTPHAEPRPARSAASRSTFGLPLPKSNWSGGSRAPRNVRHSVILRRCTACSRLRTRPARSAWTPASSQLVVRRRRVPSCRRRRSGRTRDRVRELLARMVDIGFVVARARGRDVPFRRRRARALGVRGAPAVDAVLVEIDGLLDAVA